MERRLAANLATDVVGYARLIRVDEEGTIAARCAGACTSNTGRPVTAREGK
jgi:Fe-S cluster biogenesis protein NfuA